MCATLYIYGGLWSTGQRRGEGVSKFTGYARFIKTQHIIPIYKCISGYVFTLWRSIHTVVFRVSVCSIWSERKRGIAVPKPLREVLNHVRVSISWIISKRDVRKYLYRIFFTRGDVIIELNENKNKKKHEKKRIL